MLTDTKLRNLKPRDKLYKENDRDGLCVAVTPAGSISFRYNYSIHGRQESITFGRYGVGGITLAEARERLGEAKKMLAAGESPAERITVSGSVAFKAAVIRAAVDARLPITFADPALESRRQAEATKAKAKYRPGVPAVGQEPPLHRRHGLRTLGQLDGLHIEGEAQQPAQAPTQATPAPPAAKVQQPTRPVPSELEQREARLRTQMEAKKAKRQGKGRRLG